jgi:two-component system, OmpR family, alkaline phosphatase synthesis response regulator PhoP
MTRILVVEDEPTIAAAIKDDLEIEGYSVDVAKDGASALERALKQDYGLILLDVMLPRKDGFAVCREIRSAGKRTPILMLTAKGQEIDKVLGLEIGADDYVTKPFSPRELKARIRAILRRVAPERTDEPAASVYEFGNVRVDFGSCELWRNNRQVELTAMEFKLLRKFLDHRGEVLSIEKLLREVWGQDLYISDRVVYTHVSNLRNKIEPDPANPRFLVSLRGIGYRFNAH